MFSNSSQTGPKDDDVAVPGRCYLKRLENLVQFRPIEVNGKSQLTFADFGCDWLTLRPSRR